MVSGADYANEMAISLFKAEARHLMPELQTFKTRHQASSAQFGHRAAFLLSLTALLVAGSQAGRTGLEACSAPFPEAPTHDSD